MKLLRRYPEILILTLAALATRMWALFTPNSVVFDEVYFKVFSGDYLTGAYYFDIHPPLGKLLLAGWAWLLHLSPSVVTSTTDPTVVLRLLPALAGALIIPVFYIFLRSLGASKRVSTLGAALLLLDNALLVESRFILTDSLLILSGLAAVTCFLAARHRSGHLRTGLIITSVILAGAAVSMKWTGLTAIGLIGAIWLFDNIRRFKHISWRRRSAEAALILIVPALVYMGSFWLHFQLLPKSGAGDAFMSVKFQSTLVGSPTYDPTVKLTFWEKFTDLNGAMQRSEESLKTATHPYGSKWNTWPLMTRTVYYWQGPSLPNGSQGNIYLLGNPIVWWGILAVLLLGVVTSAQAFERLKAYRLALGILLLGYAANFVPFSRIERVMFLYHYFFALIFSLALAAITLGALAGWHTDGKHPWKFSSPASRYLYWAVLGVAALGFIYFAPLTYGWPLSPAELGRHMWLPTWR